MPGPAAITVVIPAHNEQEAIAPQIEAVDHVMRETGREYEIIVVDDGSTDETTARARACGGAKILQLERNLGYGAALKAGITQAKFDWILIIDADLTYPATAIPSLLEHIPEYDMAVGARVEKGASIRRPAKWLLRQYAGYTVGRRIPDLNSGMRLMRKSVVEEFLHLLPSGFSFTTTITLSMLANGYKVHYEPIDYFKRVGRSKIRPTDFFRIFALISRLAMMFNPTRILLPVGALALLPGGADFRYDIIPIDSGAGLAGAGGLALAAVLPREKLLEAIQRVHWHTLAAAISIFVAIHCLGAVKWRMLTNRAGARFSLTESMRFYYAGLFGNRRRSSLPARSTRAARAFSRLESSRNIP